MTRLFATLNYSVLALLATLAILLAGLFLPASVGYQVRLVTSGSMEPAIPLGAVVVVRHADSYKVGEVITFQRSGEQATTHRIMRDEIASGVLQYRVQGDANDAEDARPVRVSEILGKVWVSIPYLGYVIDFLRKPVGMAVVVAIPLVLYAMGNALKPRKFSEVSEKTTKSDTHS